MEQQEDARSVGLMRHGKIDSFVMQNNKTGRFAGWLFVEWCPNIAQTRWGDRYAIVPDYIAFQLCSAKTEKEKERLLQDYWKESILPFLKSKNINKTNLAADLLGLNVAVNMTEQENWERSPRTGYRQK